MKLSNISRLNQNAMLNAYKFGVQQGENVLAIGPSGSGKTEMAYTACQESGYNPLYWNMSVMERPDIQGLPAISDDRKTSVFLPQESMPFVGLDLVKKNRDQNDRRRALSTIIEYAENNSELHALLTESKKLLLGLNEETFFGAVKECYNLFSTDIISGLSVPKNISLTDAIGKIGNENSKNILLLDEVDKTPHENLQPLLELLLYKSINARPVNVHSIIMTGNLPDEHAYSEPLSHAITARCMVFELFPEAKIWLDWANKEGLHAVICGFLSRDENAAEMFNKRPTNNELYNYAYPSPRSWTKASRINVKFDKWVIDNPGAENLRSEMNASVLGTEASAKIDVWLKYFKKYDSVIDQIFNGSNIKPHIDESTQDENLTALIVIVMAISNRFGMFARLSSDTAAVQTKAAHVFGWIENNVAADIKNAAFRSCFNFELFQKHDLQSFPPTKHLWMQIIDGLKAINSGHAGQ